MSADDGFQAAMNAEAEQQRAWLAATCARCTHVRERHVDGCTCEAFVEPGSAT